MFSAWLSHSFPASKPYAAHVGHVAASPTFVSWPLYLIANPKYVHIGDIYAGGTSSNICHRAMPSLISPFFLAFASSTSTSSVAIVGMGQDSDWIVP